MPVYTKLTGIPPPPSLGYIRADLWGVTIPGLPKIPGGATGPAQSRMLSYLLQQYPAQWQDEGLRVHGGYGYTHFFLSWPDARSFGLSIADYVALSQKVQRAGLWPCHFLRSKDYDPFNPNPTDVYPVVDALLSAGVMPFGVHAWEQSLFNTPEHTRLTIDSDATRYPQVKWAVHLQEAYAAYGPDGPNQGPKFWKANIAVGVKLLLYQYTASWSAGMMAARGNDVSVRFVQGGTWGLPETVDWCGFEVIANAQFNNWLDGDGRVADENIGNLKCYENCCTPGPVPASGYGNGGRRPDGSRL